jgi:hypothetical protein
MKKLIIVFLLFSVFGFSQKKYVFDHYAIYKCKNGFNNSEFKILAFGNSTDHDYIFELGINGDDEVISIILRYENFKKCIIYNITPFPFKNFNPDIHLKSFSINDFSNNTTICNTTFDKEEVNNLIENTTLTTYSIYKNSKKKKISYKVEVISFVSDKVLNPNFYFVHGSHFFNCNKINFSPNAIKSYKMIKNGKLVESKELVELDKTTFSINYKE